MMAFLLFLVAMSTTSLLEAFVVPCICGGVVQTTTTTTRSIPVVLFQQQNDDGNDDDDDDDDDVELVGKLEDSSSGNTINMDLSAELGKQLKPMSKEDMDDIKAEVTEMINDKFADQIDRINEERERMKRQNEEATELKKTKAQLNSQIQTEKILKNVEKKVEEELERTAEWRQRVNLIAQAIKNTEENPFGVEDDVYGYVGGVAVPKNMPMPNPLDESVSSKESKESFGEFGESSITETAATDNTSPRILIVADEIEDKIAMQIIPKFTKEIEKSIPGITVSTVKPKSSTSVPIGGDNSQCLIMFATSLIDGKSIANILKRAIKRTISVAGGQITSPPTQLILVSTVGTSRTDKMPYSMQNFIGGKLSKRLEIEETLKLIVKQKYSDTTIESSLPLDYTIMKLGEIDDDKTNNEDVIQLLPGDVLDGTISTDIAVQTLLQAVAYQPYARNSTLCVTGGTMVSSENKKDDNNDDVIWNDLFLRLDGPELYRTTDDEENKEGLNGPKDVLIELIDEWSQELVNSKRLTTPARVEASDVPSNPVYENVKERYGVKLIFLPTNTGSAYLSRSEERQMESASNTKSSSKKSSSSSSSKPKKPPIVIRRQGKDGGVEVFVEVTNDDILRIRARRCNMDDNTVIKELSEQSILKSLKEKIDTWKQMYP